MKKVFAMILFCLLLAGCHEELQIRELSTVADIPREELVKEWKGRSREDFHEAWGEPDGQLSGLDGEIWEFAPGSNLFLYFENNKVTDVSIAIEAPEP